jgi:hypothetical protein
MKNLLALIALVVLFSASVFATASVPKGANNFTTEVICPDQSFSAQQLTFELGNLKADGNLNTVTTQAATWTLNNWGNDGKFYLTEATSWAPPANGTPTDVSVVEVWSSTGLVTNLTSNTATTTGGDRLEFASKACNAQAIFTLTISQATAVVTSAKGQYTLTVTLTETPN